jgi:SEC-C motif
MKLGRNDPCPCGSGKKYKHCCLLQIVMRLEQLGIHNSKLKRTRVILITFLRH